MIQMRHKETVKQQRESEDERVRQATVIQSPGRGAT